MMDSLKQFLNATQSDASYRIDAVLKKTEFETTERVFFVGATGGEQGPYIRKTINTPEGSSLGSAYQRIYEAQQAGQRFHRLPHIVSCYSTSQQISVVMEHVAGITLQDARRQQKLDTRLVFDQICSAVRELHEQFEPPIIHRDLKPSNIMISSHDVTLIDFGIARSFDKEIEADTTQFGTRSYAPPEQFGFSQTDERSDVFALGLLLFFLETGQEPTAANRAAHFSHPELDEQLRGIVNRATAFDPSQRFATVRDLQKAASIAYGASNAKEGKPTQICPLPDQRSKALKAWGVIRNIFAVLVTALNFAVFADCVLNPATSDQTIGLPTWLRALIYGSFFSVPVLCACYALADKTPLRKRIPFFLRIKGKTERIALVVITLASFTLFLFLAALVSPTLPPVSK